MSILTGENIEPPWPSTAPLVGDHHTWTVVTLLISWINEALEETSELYSHLSVFRVNREDGLPSEDNGRVRLRPVHCPGP